MGVIKSSKTLFFTTSPRSPKKLIPEITLLVDGFSGQSWSGNEQVQEKFARTLADATTFEGNTSKSILHLVRVTGSRVPHKGWVL